MSINTDEHCSVTPNTDLPWGLHDITYAETLTRTDKRIDWSKVKCRTKRIVIDTRRERGLCPFCGTRMSIFASCSDDRFDLFVYKCPYCEELSFLLEEYEC